MPARIPRPRTVSATHGVVPVIEEAPTIERARKVVGRVRVTKRVTTRDVPVDVELQGERVQVKRVRVGREVAAPPPVRQDGDTTIVPVLEERVVVEKRLVLREEIHITRVRTTARAQKRVQVRAEEVDVERIGKGEGDAAAGVGPARRGPR